MRGNLTSVLLPPLDLPCSLSLICDLTAVLPARLATVMTWIRLSALSPAEVSTLSTSRGVSEDDWYGIAQEWFRESLSRVSVSARYEEERIQAQHTLNRWGDMGCILKNHLSTSSRGATNAN